MAKIIFEFDSVEDKDDIKIHYQALNMFAVLHDLSAEFRQEMKHGNPTKRDRYWNEVFHNLLTDRKVELD